MKVNQALICCIYMILFAPAQGADIGISDSYIEANVPDAKVFDEILRRDLESYFTKALGAKVAADYILLSDRPTQTGLSYPRFYLWVYIKKDGIVIEEGVTKVSAIDKKEFEIGQYVNKGVIIQDPENLRKSIPQGLCDKVMEYALK